MIKELRVKNLALIQELSLDLESGFSVFTGETGAGKSILIGAIGLLLGERASAEMIRSGYEEAWISGIFDVEEIKTPLAKLLEDQSIEPEDGQLIIRRKISRNGRNQIHINQIPVTLNALKKLGDQLIDLHGQHEHQSLLNEDYHQLIIDYLPEVLPCKQKYDECYRGYMEASRKLETHLKKARELSEKKDIIQFQLNELTKLELRCGEEQDLESELSLLSSSAQRTACISEILEILNDSINKKISFIRKKLENLSKYDSSVVPWITDIETAGAAFTELETYCSTYAQNISESTDPARLEFINSRLSKIQRLKKKYSCSIDELIIKQQKLQQELQSLENIESDRELLEKKVNASLENCLSAGKVLREKRKKASEEFDMAVSLLMEKLGFRGGKWKTKFHQFEKPTPDGLEAVTFTVCTNPGEPLLPLAKTASGGEISRLMLAIKTVLAEHDNIPVLIFDEIDTGIGGMLAVEVGKALYSLSNSHQVLCISHLHQIASLADQQYKVFKEISEDRTVTRVINLSFDERIEEIARMLGGSSDISIKHARELLEKRKFCLSENPESVSGD